MGNNRTGAAARIRNICRSKSLEEKDIYTKARMLLEIYRDICWDVVSKAWEVRESASWELEYCSHDVGTALMYLEDFAPTEKKEKFTERIQSLFEVKWMIEIVDSAMVKVKDFPVYGDLYFDLLARCYLGKFQYSEAEILEEMKMERSSYYRRKQEAVKVFGLAIWGGQLEEYRSITMETGPVQMHMDLGLDINYNYVRPQ